MKLSDSRSIEYDCIKATISVEWTDESDLELTITNLDSLHHRLQAHLEALRIGRDEFKRRQEKAKEPFQAETSG